MKKKKRILITGGSGFLGGHVAEKLIKEGYFCYIIDINEPKFLKIYKNKYSYFRGKISDRKLISKIIKKVDIVYHFAAEADIGTSRNRIMNTIKLNLFDTVELLNICAKNKIERFIFASSIYVFSEQGGVYRSTKQACEILIENFNEELGLNYTILRYGSLYGTRANNFNWIYKVINNIKRNKVIRRESNGFEKRQYINAEDAALASIKILDKKFKNKHVLLTGNKEFSIRQILNKIIKISGKKVSVKYLNKSNLKDHYKNTPYTYTPRKGIKMQIGKQKNFNISIKEIFNELN